MAGLTDGPLDFFRHATTCLSCVRAVYELRKMVEAKNWEPGAWLKVACDEGRKLHEEWAKAQPDWIFITAKGLDAVTVTVKIPGDK